MKKSGFTLIEMLVVVAIIGILSAFVLTEIGDVRGNVRDTKRIADIRLIQAALEAYYDRMDGYPANLYEDILYIPHDPQRDPVTGEAIEYGYKRKDNGESYLIGVCLERLRPAGLVHKSENFYMNMIIRECNCLGERVFCTGVF